ncbi:hypothetical protein CC2G_005187 [Coprinopsis cinerea AmutBmut pab1-1]|nr:hypothetical protein CC2G_005187 [Coprinopsis cinerea AmutBmut pab1-1]
MSYTPFTLGVSMSRSDPTGKSSTLRYPVAASSHLIGQPRPDRASSAFLAGGDDVLTAGSSEPAAEERSHDRHSMLLLCNLPLPFAFRVRPPGKTLVVEL